MRKTTKIAIVSIGMIGLTWATSSVAGGWRLAKPPTAPPYSTSNNKVAGETLPALVPVAGPDGTEIASVPRECLFEDEPAGVDCGALPVADPADYVIVNEDS